MGYGLPSPDLAISPNPRSCFWGGWGGSIISVDLDARVTIAYMMNRMGEGTLGDERGASLVAATYGALAAV
jgi:CubicO group peptidase (beta-lactamase class C family)